MRIGVPKETAADERRVALVPEVVRKLTGGGHQVVVEAGAGEQALLPDALYTDAGATIGDPYGADIVVRVAVPSEDEVSKLKSGQILIGFLAPLTRPELKDTLRAAGVQALAMESIPRISRAQSMDALSSQANVGGYKAALLGAEHSTRFYPMLMTAAGTIPPAKVLVLGAGVAGLQALATARRLGAQTTGYDVRPEVAEQVQSLGAKWLDLGIEAAGEGGYARELTDAEKAQQQQALTDAIKTFDVVITTALVPGAHGADARHGRGGRGHEARQRDRRPRGRGGRQLRADRARRGHRRARRHDRLAAEPAGHDARARQRAVRPQRPVAARADRRRGRRG